MAAWLRERGVEEAERLAVLARLAEAGAIDDERFARRFAEDKRELASWGSERIREALASRGVRAEEIEAALACDDHAAQLDRALGLLSARELGCESEAERDRALRLLARRGYPLELAYDAVRERERESGAPGAEAA